MPKPSLSAIRAMISAQAPDQTPAGQEVLASKLSFMTKHDPIAYANPKKARKKSKQGYTAEEKLQIDIIGYLSTQPRIFVWYNHKQVFLGKPTGAQMNYLVKLKKMGAKKGILDLTLLFLKRYGGCGFCMADVKDPEDGNEMQEQKDCLKAVEERGGYAAFIRSFDDLISLLERAGYWE